MESTSTDIGTYLVEMNVKAAAENFRAQNRQELQKSTSFRNINK